MKDKHLEIDYDKFESTRLIDLFGSKITIGSKLLKPSVFKDRPCIQKRIVTDIRDGKMYLDNSKVPTLYPGRCVVVKSFKRGNNV